MKLQFASREVAKGHQSTETPISPISMRSCSVIDIHSDSIPGDINPFVCKVQQKGIGHWTQPTLAGIVGRPCGSLVDDPKDLTPTFACRCTVSIHWERIGRQIVEKRSKLGRWDRYHLV
jgi:hypothetical protein